MEITKTEDQSLRQIDEILQRFRAIEMERDAAVACLRLQGSHESDPNDVQAVHCHQNGS
jgi:hypothetical protein